jgi:hypothetical protein
VVALGVVGCSAPNATERAVPLRDPDAPPLATVQRAVDLRWAAPPAAIVIEGTARRPGTAAAQTLRLTGTFDGRPDGRTDGRVHLVEESARATKPLERWLVGNDVITATTMPDVDRPWVRYDAATLDEVVATGRQWSHSTTPQVLDAFVTSREPSPLTTLRVIAAGAAAIDRGPEAVDGRTLEHYDVTTPAPAAITAMGRAASTHAALDCAAGVTTSVWIDDAGALVRMRSTIDHLAIEGDVVTTFAPTADVVRDPPAGAEVHDLTRNAAESLTKAPRGRSTTPPAPPCSVDAQRAGTALDRTACPPDERPELAQGWRQLGARMQHDPATPGLAWLVFRDPVPIDEALTLVDGAQVTSYVAVYPTKDGRSTVKAGGTIDAPAPAPETVLGQIQRQAPPEADASAPRLAAITVSGPWQAIGREATSCDYAGVDLATGPQPTLSHVR